MEDYGKFNEKMLGELEQMRASGLLSEDEAETMDGIISQTYEHMRQWREFTMRYHVNLLDIAVKQIEFSQEDIRTAIDSAAVFYGILSPKLRANADTVAKIVIHDDPAECELSYNWRLFKNAGLLTKDSLLLCFVHEVGHEYLYGKWFLLFDNELWLHELAVDMICGAYAFRHHTAIAHYKFAISRLAATPTHPDCKIREDAFLYGYLKARDEIGPALTAEAVLAYFKDFVYSRLSGLAGDWREVKKKGLSYYLAHPAQMREISQEDLSYVSTLNRVINPRPQKK